MVRVERLPMREPRTAWQGELDAVPRTGDWVSLAGLADMQVRSVTWILSPGRHSYALVKVLG